MFHLLNNDKYSVIFRDFHRILILITKISELSEPLQNSCSGSGSRGVKTGRLRLQPGSGTLVKTLYWQKAYFQQQKDKDYFQIPMKEREFIKQQRKTDGTRTGPLQIGGRDMTETQAVQQRLEREERERAGVSRTQVQQTLNEEEINIHNISVEVGGLMVGEPGVKPSHFHV